MPSETDMTRQSAAPSSHPVALPIVPLRHWGRWLAAVVVLAVAAIVVVVLARADIAYRNVPVFFLYPIMLEGLWHTIALAIVAQSSAVVVGLIIAVMRVSHNPVASYTARAHIWIFRGTPVLLQILIWYNLALAFQRIEIPFLFSVPTNSVISPFVAALLGLGMNESAYMAEIVRAGFNSIDRGQIEAAHSIGMTPGKTLRRVILPQAMRVIIPPTGNDFINMLKGTSIASVISYVELIQAANNISSHNLQVIETLLASAAWYMVLVTVASIGQQHIERAFAGDRQPGRQSMRRAVFRSLRAGPRLMV
jgi:polar amino acid transport system permease protein